MILLLMFCLSLNCLDASTVESFTEKPAALHENHPSWNEKVQRFCHHFSAGAVYCGTGAALGSTSLLAKLGWVICQILPNTTAVGNECLLVSQLCSDASKHLFTQMFRGPPSSSIFKDLPLSQDSWYLNQTHLSQIPTSSGQDKQLLLFLEKRWLAKSAGFFSSMIDWVCPSFGIFVQVHPETNNSYARDPLNECSLTYQRTAETWKQLLPHPKPFPLILTRPYDIQDYLPSLMAVHPQDTIQTIAQKLAFNMQASPSKIIIDLTQAFPEDTQNDPEKWLQAWNAHQAKLSKACKECDLNSDRICCIQRMLREEIGGIRLLPLSTSSAKEIHEDTQFLLEWISTFGLAANRIELDRWALHPTLLPRQSNIPLIPLQWVSKEEIFSDFNTLEQHWKSIHPQKTLMFHGTIQALKGLLSSLSMSKWEEIMSCPTRASIAQLSFLKIKEQLDLLIQKEDQLLFFDVASSLEQIHAHLSALLEVFSPFAPEHFPEIYRELLTYIPMSLKPFLSCGVHSSGMTCIAGIFRAVERTIGHSPRVLYGENTYFENITAAKMIAKTSSTDEATEEDWAEADLILGQFHPVLKRISFKKIPANVSRYRVENVSDNLRKSLSKRKKPLTLALDCTFDPIHSPQVATLLEEFHEEIQTGILNIICFRSGIKFDLFGMDNYCGAPFYMIHNLDPKWASFDLLLTDPILQTDLLSLNWFCLAYKYSVSQLQLYQKQIFDNTRALLNKIPARLFDPSNTRYRVIPMEEGLNPAFIDIKIFGPLHAIRGSALVAGILTLKCMEGGHPLFYRQSLGFYHPNLCVLFDDECTTIRLTIGLDPAQVDILAKCFETIDALRD